MAFITFEGGEGAGKSTQLAFLVEALRSAGIKAIATREPGGTSRAEDIRNVLISGEEPRLLPFSQALLLNAARFEHVGRVIKPALAKGEWVISDRFADSTRVYQGHGLGVEDAVLATLESLTIGPLKPDVTFIFDIDPDLGLSRLVAGGRKKDHYETMERAFHDRLRQGYLDLASSDPRRCVVLNAAAAPEDVSNHILGEIGRRFGVAF